MPKSPTWSDFISPVYLGEQRRLHLKPEGYGGRGAKWADAVAKITDQEWGAQSDGLKLGKPTILDYGCGQGSLGLALTATGHTVENYDPAMRQFEAMPYPADVVVCTDVLEHVEPEKIKAVMAHLRSLTGWVLFTVISTVETAKTLSDGRQAHILLRDAEWWALTFEGAGFEAIDCDVHNPKPEKQLVNLWRPV